VKHQTNRNEFSRHAPRGACLLAAAVVVSLSGTWLVAEDKPADAPTAEQIVQKTNYVSYYQGKDGRAKVKMTVTDKQGQQRQKEMVLLRWDAQEQKATDAKTADFQAGDAKFTGEQKFFVYFKSPPDDNKTTFLVWKHLDKDDDRWLYLPNLDLLKRIAGSDKRTSFVGSHFFYEDVSGRNVDADKHELVKTTDTYYVLRNTPKDTTSAEFAYYEMYILKSNFLVAYTMYYDGNGKKYRTYTVNQWDKDATFGYPVVRKATMQDDNLGGNTVLEYEDIRFNIDVPESLFTERFLKRTPYKYLE